ncbi:MAG TPA: helix-turn-helix transcriptional regulator [Ktedonobacteraceae bacterium]|jgi:transcriptional regulator with XRE-family HTH domain|nr:helix-turn-helix transcriptional regulator [Ktedonobacteraceae bacterium]
MLNSNAFGQLVRAYREQRGWTQEELAERWGYARAYVSQIERGKRKLDSMTQVLRLADILDIPQEKLEEIGRGIPKRKIDVQKPEQADSAILQMLLAPGRDMVQLSYMVWIADQAPLMEEKLQELITTLDQALISYHGEFLKPAQQLLAYTHLMRGRMAFDRLDFAAAAGHFSEVIDLGHELNDPDIITIGMVYQGSLLRKRGRFETAIRCFEAAKSYAEAAAGATRGIYHVNFSTVYADSGQEKSFLGAIDAALEIAKDMKDSITGLANDFSLDDVLWAQAGGFSELWKPGDALKIYEQTDKLRPFRPLRELGAYTIDKGEAFLKLGDLDQGIALTMKGIQLATEYQSRRHLGWVEKTYNRLLVLPIGKDKRLDTLRDALVEAKRKVEI